MNYYKPSLLIALDPYGKKSVDASLQYISETDEFLYNYLISDYSFEGQHFSSLKSPGIEKYEVKASDGVGKYHFNYSTILDYEEQFIASCNSLFKELESIENQNRLILKDVSTGRPQVCLFASTFHPVGSSWIIPVLKFLNKLPNHPEVNLFLFLPELSSETAFDKQRMEKARSFACLTELDDWFADANLTNLNMIYVLGSRNEEGRLINNIEECLQPLTEYVYLGIKNEILTDQSFKYIFSATVQNTEKLKRCSAFGVSKLVYSRSSASEALKARGKFEILSALVQNNQLRKVDANYINTEVGKYLHSNEYYNIGSLLEKTSDGSNIYESYHFDGIPDDQDSKTPDFFFNELDKASENFNNKDFKIFIEKLSAQKQNIETRIIDSYSKQVSSIFDDEHKGYSYASSFTNHVVKKDSRFMKGNVLSEVENFESVYHNIRRFYTTKLGLDVKEKDNNELSQQIKSKKKLLEDRERNINELEQQLSSLGDSQADEVNCSELTIKYTTSKDENRKLQLEIITLDKKYNADRAAIEHLNKQIEDISFRKEMMNDEAAKIQSEIADMKKSIAGAHEKIISANRNLEELHEKKKNLLKWLVYIIPATIIVALTALIYFTSIDNPLWVAAVVLVVYAIVALIVYYLKNGLPIRNAKEELAGLVLMKKRMQADLVNKHDNYFSCLFKHHLNSYALELIIVIGSKLNQIANQVDSFIKLIEQQVNEYSSRWEALMQSENKTFIRNVLSGEDLLHLFETKKEKVNHYFSDGSTLSKWFDSYIEVQEFKAIDSRMDSYLTSELSPVFDRNLLEVLYDEHVNAPVKALLTMLFAASKPTINLKDDQVNGEPGVFHLVYIPALNSIQAEKIKEVITNLGIINLFPRESANLDMITFVTINVGYALYQVSSVDECKVAFESCIKKEGRKDVEPDLFIEDHYFLHSLYPQDEEEIRRDGWNNIIVAIASGIIEYNDETANFTLGSKQLGSSTQHVIKYLNTVKGEKDKAIINSKVEKFRNDLSGKDKEGRLNLSKYIEKNPAHLSNAELKMVEDFLMEVAPV
jgi:hypothetical protein